MGISKGEMVKARMLCHGPLLCAILFTVFAIEVDARQRQDVRLAEVVILGTLHEFHDQCPQYSRDALRDIIIAINPAVLLYEMPSMLDGAPTLVDGRICSRFRDNESIAANQAADSLGIRLAPYDIEGRNEFYTRTNYFEREARTFRDLMEWGSQSDEESDRPLRPIATANLFNSIQQAQMHLVMRADPTVINSPAFDSLVRSKHILVYDVWPRLLRADGEEFLAKELQFFNTAVLNRTGLSFPPAICNDLPA
jgi:hypothetical protein